MNEDLRETIDSNDQPGPQHTSGKADSVPTVREHGMGNRGVGDAPTTSPLENDDPFVGTMLGNYRLTSLLGKGGFGKVYKGMDTALERPAAIKFLLNPLNEVGRTLFEREARAIASLSKHPHIVSIYEWGQHNNQFYFVLEFVEGGALQLLELHPDGLPLRQALRIAAECAEALHTAHEQGILHRDIKPGNILIESNSGAAKLTDFGLAHIRDANDFTIAGSLSGSPPYMSPEQASAGDLDARSDVFSLGVTLYELLSGARPFEGATTNEVLQKVRNDQRVPFSRRRPDLGQAVVDLVEKATAHKPSDRYASAAEFARKIRVLIDRIDRSGELTPQITPPQEKPLDKRLIYGGMGIAAVLLVGVLGVFSLTGGNGNPPPPDDPIVQQGLANLEEGDYSAAEADFRQFASMGPEQAASVLGTLFLTQVFQGKVEDARETLEGIDDDTLKQEAAALLDPDGTVSPDATPSSPLLMVPYARALLAEGHADRVVELLGGLSEGDFPYPWLYREAQQVLGQAYYKLGNWQNAQRAFAGVGDGNPMALAYTRALDNKLDEERRANIREAAKRIRTMLDNREAHTLDQTDDLWTSRPLTFFMLPSDRGNGSFPPEPGLPDILHELLTDALMEASRMSSVDRENIAAILEEQELSARMSGQAGQMALGRILGARLIVQCRFGRLGGRDFLTVSATDVESGRKHTARVELPEDYPGPMAVIEQAKQEVLTELTAEYPLQGRIYRQNGEVLLNIGSDTGVAQGMTFDLYADPQAPPAQDVSVTVAGGVGAGQARVDVTGIDVATLPEAPEEGLLVRVKREDASA